MGVKYTEFIEKVEELGYGVSGPGLVSMLVFKGDICLLRVHKERKNLLNIYHDYFEDWDLQLLKLAIELAETPLEEREEVKKYCLRHKYLEEIGHTFLNRSLRNGALFLDDDYDSLDYQVEFTKQEIKDIEATGFDLRNFEMIEVTDE